ncbi:uncharacterized protein [Mytilus edulis]|uniref:uncharacterized protein n=1 Tax=Mytilus edulis TaxID=6550 RepID=UPI0039EF8EC5
MLFRCVLTEVMFWKVIKTVLSEHLQQNNNIQSLWSGSYIAMLPWMEILGCFRIQKMNDVEEIVFSKSTTGVNSAVCQVKCSHAKYFAVNSDTSRCACFDDHRLIDLPSLKAAKCLHSCVMNDTDCFELLFTYKVLNDTDIHLDNPTDTLKSCVYSDCISSQQHYEKDDCNKRYIAQCRNGQYANYPTEYATYDALLWGCVFQQDTFPLLLSTNSCELDQRNAQHWVGVRSQKLDIHHMGQYEIGFETVKNRIVTCGHYDRSGFTFGNCSIQNHFICKTGSSGSIEGSYALTSAVTTSLQNDSNDKTECSNTTDYTEAEVFQNATLEMQTEEDSSSINAYIVVLAAVMATLVIGISVTTVFVLKRKFHTNKRSESCERHISNLRHNSTHISMHDNSKYTDIDINREDSFKKEVANTSYNDSTNTTNGYRKFPPEISETDDPNRGNQIVRKHFNNMENNTNTVFPVKRSLPSSMDTVSTIQSSEYSLVTPRKGVTDVNILTNNSDYDHLNDFTKDTMSEGKLYDHVITVRDSDPTYDHFQINNTKTKDKNYDHVSDK